MKIFVASDHAGFELKGTLVRDLAAMGHEVEDCGPSAFDATDDYPDFCIPLAKKVAGEPESFGVVIGKSGVGEAIAANRVRGARAVVYCGGNTHILKLSREHNNANILSLGSDFVHGQEAADIVLAWASTPFSAEERHVRRINKLDEA